MKNRLNVVSELTPRQKVELKFEKLWKNDPQQFDPESNALERERIECTLSLIPKMNKPFRVADLGCGTGYFSKKLRDLGGIVDAVDIANTPLSQLVSEKKINPIQDYVPKTTLEDDTYDLVLCTELIAYLPENEYRLLFSELARIVKPTGTLLCSSPLDYRSDDAIQRLASLAETEFTTEEWKISYHLFYLHLKNFFEAPAKYVRAAKDPEYKQKQLLERKTLGKLWLNLNSNRYTALFWMPIQWITNPIAHFIRQSRSLLLSFEKACRFLWSESGITHAIFSAKRRMLEKIPEDEQPIERKHKREVWE